MSEHTDGFTELVDPDIDQVDAVEKAANGTTILFAKSAGGERAGLFAPEFVREQLAKGEPDQVEAFRPSSAPISISGTPAAVADMMARIHGAPVRKAEAFDPELDRVVKAADGDYVAFVKAKYTAEQKRELASRGHAMRNAEGEPDYPVDDEEDLGKAIHAVGRGGADHDKIRRYVMRRAREMGHADRIPDNWASDGSIKEPAGVAKADFGPMGTGAGTDPGSPAWETQDASGADAVVAQILACIPCVQALAMREATEVGAGHLDDVCDVVELQSAIDALTCAAKTVGAFAVSERAEAGSVTKAHRAPSPAAAAAPAPKENAVSETQTATQHGAETVAKAEPQAASAAALSEAELAEYGRQQLAKAAKKAAKKKMKASGAAGAPAESARTIPGTDTVQSPVQGQDEVSKAAATQLATAFGQAVAPVVTQLGELATQVGAQLERVEKMAATPDDRRSPLLNGANGQPGPAQRGAIAQSPEMATILKAIEAIPEGPARDEAKRKVALQALERRFS